MGYADGFRPIAITSRSDHDESVHFGAAVVVDAAGGVIASIGDRSLPIYPRSSNKPLQADAMVALGVGLSPEQLALARASHDGTPRHVEVVRSTLALVGRDERALDNTPDFPIDPESAESLIAAGIPRAPITMNCSGKHAAMVATCVRNEWPIDGYLAFDHSLQVAITERVAELAGGVSAIGVDGCGAPAHVLSLDGLARAFAALAADRGAVWQAMTTHPDLVGGDRRDVTRLMRAVPELMAKDGAEGVFVAALPDGVSAAVKISDGASRASGVVLAAVLAAVGIDLDVEAIGEPIRGHGQPVGRVRPIVTDLQ